MAISLLEKIHQLNYFVAEIDALYHNAALRIGLSDSAMKVLYTICDNGGSCKLSEICKQSCLSKQTVNSALRKLEADNVLYLELQDGKSKKVCLTEYGKTYASKTVYRLISSERDAYSSWTEHEINTHLHLMAKYAETFRQQIEKL